MEAKRDSKIEALRIVSMIMIVFCHSALVPFRLVPGSENVNFVLNNVLKSSTLQSLGIFGRFGNLLFIMISGYFLSRMSFSGMRVFKTVEKVLSYTWLSGVLALIFGIKIGYSGWVRVFFPITFGAYWFVTDFVVLILISPFLNQVCKHISIRARWAFLGVVLLGSSVIPTVSLDASLTPGLQDIGIFIAAYLWAGIVRDGMKISKIILIWGTFFSVFIQVAGIFSINVIAEYNSSILHMSSYLNSQESIVLFIGSACIFALVVRGRSFSNSIINNISKYSFGVYLVHTNLIFFKWIFKNTKVLTFTESASFIQAIVFVILFSIFVYIVSSVFDVIYSFLLQRIGFYRMMESLFQRTTDYLKKFRLSQL